jgi:hypothetical protein
LLQASDYTHAAMIMQQCLCHDLRFTVSTSVHSLRLSTHTAAVTLHYSHCHTATTTSTTIIRCTTCPTSLCEDCLPEDDVESVGRWSAIENLGYRSKQAYWIRCEKCLNGTKDITEDVTEDVDADVGDVDSGTESMLDAAAVTSSSAAARRASPSVKGSGSSSRRSSLLSRASPASNDSDT